MSLAISYHADHSLDESAKASLIESFRAEADSVGGSYCTIPTLNESLFGVIEMGPTRAKKTAEREHDAFVSLLKRTASEFGVRWNLGDSMGAFSEMIGPDGASDELLNTLEGIREMHTA